MAHFGTCTLSVRDRSEDSVQVPILKAAELGERWPVLLWFYLKMLGLYHSGKYDITSNIVHCFYFYRRNGAWGTGGSEPPDPTSHTPVFSPFSVAPTSVSFLLENYIVQCCKSFPHFPLFPPPWQSCFMPSLFQPPDTISLQIQAPTCTQTLDCHGANMCTVKKHPLLL